MTSWKRVLLGGAAGGGDGLWSYFKITGAGGNNRGCGFDTDGNVYYGMYNVNDSYNRILVKFDSDLLLTKEVEIDSNSGGNSNYFPTGAVAFHEGHVYTGATVSTIANNYNHCAMVKTNPDYASGDGSRTFQGGTTTATAFQNMHIDEHIDAVVGSYRSRSSANARNSEYGYAWDADTSSNLDEYSVTSNYVNTHTRGWQWQHSSGVNTYLAGVALSPNLGGVYQTKANAYGTYTDIGSISNFNGSQAMVATYWPYAASGASWSSSYAVANTIEQTGHTNMVRDSNNNIYFGHQMKISNGSNGVLEVEMAIFKISYSTGNVTAVKSYKFDTLHVPNLNTMSLICGTDDRLFVGGSGYYFTSSSDSTLRYKELFVMELDTSLAVQRTISIKADLTATAGSVTNDLYGYSVDRTNGNIYMVGAWADNGITSSDRYSHFIARIPLDGSSNGSYTIQNMPFSIESPSVTTTSRTAATGSVGSYWSVSNNYISNYGGQDTPSYTDKSNTNSVANIFSVTPI
jgi:hypothetical protein